MVVKHLLWKKALLSTILILLFTANACVLTFAYKLYKENLTSKDVEKSDSKIAEQTNEEQKHLSENKLNSRSIKATEDQMTSQNSEENYDEPVVKVESNNASSEEINPELSVVNRGTLTFNGSRLLLLKQGESNDITTHHSWLSSYVSWNEGEVVFTESKEPLQFDAIVQVTGYKDNQEQFYQEFIAQQQGFEIFTPIHEGNAYLTYSLQSGPVEQGIQSIECVLTIAAEDTANNGWVYHVKVSTIRGYRDYPENPSVAVTSGTNEHPIDEFAVKIGEEDLLETSDQYNNYDTKGEEASTSEELFRVQAGVFSSEGNALTLESDIKEHGIETAIVEKEGLYVVYVGAFSVKENADNRLAELESLGFDGLIKYE